jgi:Glycosyltransferase family 87
VRRRLDPHVALGVAVAVVLVLEALRGEEPVATSPAWPLLQAAVAGVALVWAWRRQDQLRIFPLLGLAVAFNVGWVAVHLALGVPSDWDSRVIYPPQGNALLDGEYPRSEYPPGAVLLFALEVLLGGGEARVSNALLMIPFHVATVWAIWELRTRWSAWFAAVVALWPLNAFFWEFRFDVVPTALLVAGLVLAWRERWGLSGIALGLGAAVKWTPALAAAALALWLLTHGAARSGARHALAFAGTLLAVHVPFLLWAPGDVLHAYTEQSGRGITGESLPYIPLHVLGLASVPGEFWDAAEVPGWANAAAVVAQGLLLAAFGLMMRLARSLRVAVAFAALLPVVFLIPNRIFSPQFLVVLLAAWAVAGALLSRSRIDQLAFCFAALAATLANALVYPTQSPDWFRFSAAMFFLAIAASAWVVVRGATDRVLTRTP